MTKHHWATPLLLAATVPAAGQAPTMQARYDAATALDATGTPEQRLAAWSALEAAAATNKRSRAIFRVRKSAALLALYRLDEAADAARAGLADLPAGDATLRQDRFNAQYELGMIAEAGLDYGSAAAAFRLAEPTAPAPEDQLRATLGELRTATFVDPDAASAAAARADALVAAGNTDSGVEARLRRREAELLLNRGDLVGAKARAGAAVKLLGGLTDKVSLEGMSARSDYAIAALLGGDAETARKYLAYTGAGHFPNGFDPALQMTTPDCGGEAGLKPTDDAVVEFSIADDGSVVDNHPVYAKGGGAVALAFARATADWSWRPEQVKALPPFFRNRIRVELRCATSFTRPSVIDFLDARLSVWLDGKGVEVSPPPAASPSVALAGERAMLAAAEAKAGASALALVPVLRALAANPVLPRDERNAVASRALAILEKNGATGAPRLAVELRVWASDAEDGTRFYRDRLPALAAGRYADDPEARGAVALLTAGALGRDRERQRAALRSVADDAKLDSTSPIRVAALVRLASLEQRAGNADAARAAFAKTNLSADQCALVDSPPKLLGTSGRFPDEALRWGFEGWTAVQFDVRADGQVANERTVIAYPPFVFADAGARTMASAHYAKTFRPDGQLGCGGETQRVKFKMPH